MYGDRARPASASPNPKAQAQTHSPVVDDAVMMLLNNVGALPTSPKSWSNSSGPGRSSTRGQSVTTLPRIHRMPSEEDEVAKCSIKVGDRVTVPGPRGAGTASACSAVVKYVGRLDNDVPDYNLYIGVKLDDPISDTDGLFKGKRYFTCPDNHGHFCPVDDVLQVVSSRGKRKSTRRENGRS